MDVNLFTFWFNLLFLHKKPKNNILTAFNINEYLTSRQYVVWKYHILVIVNSFYVAIELDRYNCILSSNVLAKLDREGYSYMFSHKESLVGIDSKSTSLGHVWVDWNKKQAPSQLTPKMFHSATNKAWNFVCVCVYVCWP